MLQPRMHREESAEGRSTQPGIPGAGTRAVFGVDERLDHLDQRADISFGFSTVPLGVTRGCVLIDTLLARVVDSDNYHRLDAPLANQLLRRLVQPPVFAGDVRRRRIEKVLPILTIKKGETP